MSRQRRQYDIPTIGPSPRTHHLPLWWTVCLDGSRLAGWQEAV